MLRDDDDDGQPTFLLEDPSIARRQRWLTVGLAFFAIASIGLAASLTFVVLGSRSRDLSSEYASLSGYCDHVSPVGLDEFATRRTRLAQSLAASGQAAYVTEPGASMTYFADVQWKLSERAFLLVVTAARDEAGTHDAFFVVPAFEEGTAREAIGPALGENPPIAFWEEDQSPFTVMSSYLGGLTGQDPASLSVVVDHETRSFVYFGLADEFGIVGNGIDMLRDVRAIKSAAEIDIMRCANEATKAAIRAVAERLTAGMSEDDGAAHIDAALTTAGLRDTWSLVLFGVNAAFPHGTDNRLSLSHGTMVLIDAGGELYGYQSDITRTFTFPLGVADDAQRKMWNAVRDAQRAALDAISVGVEAQSIDAAARHVVGQRGYGFDYEYFTHRLGHGIGLQGHEEIYMVRNNTLPLKPGHCFSVEPGLYNTTYGGVRIEDIVCVTSSPPYYELFGPESESLDHPFANH